MGADAVPGTSADRPSGRAIMAALAVIFLVRFAAGTFTIGRGSFLQHDGEDYNDLARNVAGGRGYLVDRVRWFEPPRSVPAPDFSRPPLVPLVLAAFYAALPDSLYVASGVAAVTGMLACLVCAALARSLWGETAFRRTLLLAGAWPVFIYYSAHLSTEAMMSLLVAGLALALVVLSRDGGGRPSRAVVKAALAGLLLGLSALARPTMLVGFGIVPLWAAIFLKCGRARRACLAGVILGAACLTVAPWTARNFAASGDFIPVSIHGGYVFWLGNNEDGLRAYSSLGYGEFLDHQNRAFRVEGRRLVAEMARRGIARPAAQERFWMGEGLRFVREHPGGYAFLVVARLWHFFRPGLNPAAYGWPMASASLAMWGLLYAAGTAGLARLWRKERAAALAICAIVLSGAVAHSLTLVVVRHRVPFLDTAAIVLAPPVLLGWARALLARLRGRRGSEQEEAAPVGPRPTA